MRIQKNHDSVLITDLGAAPLALKHASLSMPAAVWEALLQRVGLEERKVWEGRVDKLEFRADKKAIAAELKRGTEIPGTEVRFGEWRLVIR